MPASTVLEALCCQQDLQYVVMFQRELDKEAAATHKLLEHEVANDELRLREEDQAERLQITIGRQHEIRHLPFI